MSQRGGCRYLARAMASAPEPVLLPSPLRSRRRCSLHVRPVVLRMPRKGSTHLATHASALSPSTPSDRAMKGRSKRTALKPASVGACSTWLLGVGRGQKRGAFECF